MVSEAVCNAMEADSRATEKKKLTGMVGIEKKVCNCLCIGLKSHKQSKKVRKVQFMHVSFVHI